MVPAEVGPAEGEEVIKCQSPHLTCPLRVWSVGGALDTVGDTEEMNVRIRIKIHRE